jgi:hypothetical protein
VVGHPTAASFALTPLSEMANPLSRPVIHLLKEKEPYRCHHDVLGALFPLPTLPKPALFSVFSAYVKGVKVTLPVLCIYRTITIFKIIVKL